MVSGADFRIVAFPSNLKCNKYFLKIKVLQHLCEMFSDKLNNTTTRASLPRIKKTSQNIYIHVMWMAIILDFIITVILHYPILNVNIIL